MGTCNQGVGFDYEIYVGLLPLIEAIEERYGYDFDHEILPVLAFDTTITRPSVTHHQVLEAIRELTLKLGEFMLINEECKDNPLTQSILRNMEHMRRTYKVTCTQTPWEELYHVDALGEL
ncbi:MAG: hypothetical protein SVK08_01155 [Halobacteriota archaeon]|nr:hypothetical protein [Halobacteriota archaeon]